MASSARTVAQIPDLRSISRPPSEQAAPAPQAISSRPFAGVFAVLMGAFISTVTARLSTFGLADIRGALHVGVDEGAWITTAQTVGQMLIGPVAAWLGAVYGPRTVLLRSCAIFAATSLILPFTDNLAAFLALQFVAGLASGTFIPLSIGFVVQNLPPRLWAYGMAAYAMNLELSLNISASLEGWYTENASWRWIFWQSMPLSIAMAGFVAFGIPRAQINRSLLKKADWFGMASVSIGLAMIYAALDQGNRLDWFNSGLITGLMTGGTVLLIAFVFHERQTAQPWLDFTLATSGNMPLLMILISVLRFAILATSYVIPQYLTSVQGYRALDTGQVLLFIAIPQIVIAPLCGFLLRRIDGRLLMLAGFGLAGVACWSVAIGLTKDWATGDFLPSQIMQAVGQSLAMSSVVFFAVLNVKPADALTFGTLIQVARLFGGELGLGFINTLVRVREQVASALINLHLQTGDVLLNDRLQKYASATVARATGNQDAAERANALLANAVRTQANVQSYIDAFAMVALVIGAGLLIVAMLRPAPPGPASPRFKGPSKSS